jgi:hypothetical protein
MAVAKQQITAAQLLADGITRADETRIAGRQEAQLRNQQAGGIERIGTPKFFTA